MNVINLTDRRAVKESQAGYERTQGHFGLCPYCHRTDGFLNVGGNHWFVCDAHRTRWCAGWNLFSSWRDEPESLHQANAEKLEQYRACEPYHPSEAA